MPTYDELVLVASAKRLASDPAYRSTVRRFVTAFLAGTSYARGNPKRAEDILAKVTASEQGKDSTGVPDSLIFHTDRGRLVRGGGGIRPDVFVAPDTYTTAERGFLRTLGSKISVYRDVISSYALELKAGGHLTTPSFPVTPAMVDEVARRLQARGVSVPDSVVAGARSLISLELGVEAARYVFGRPAEFRRRMGRTPRCRTRSPSHAEPNHRPTCLPEWRPLRRHCATSAVPTGDAAASV